MKVLKFGGTSMGSAEAIRRVADIVISAATVERVAVVVSAMAGVTDALAAGADHAALRDTCVPDLAAGLAERHFATLASLCPNGHRTHAEAQVRRWLTRLAELLGEASRGGSCPPPLRDGILATGERLAAPLLAAKLRARGLDAVPLDGAELIVTDSRFGEAEVDWRRTTRRVGDRLAGLSAATVPVITGFVGADTEGRTTTLGRGGSDYSASLIGAALDARSVEIWTDVDGVLTAPPRLVPTAVTVPALSYAEAGALASFGAKVLHPKTMRPSEAGGIPIAVRNTFRPDTPGTLITATAAGTPGQPKAVAAREGGSLLDLDLSASGPRMPSGGVCTVALVGEGVGGNLRAAARTRAALAAEGLSVLALYAEFSPLVIAAVLPASELHSAISRLHAALGLAHPRACEGRRLAAGAPRVASLPACLEDQVR